MVKAALSQAVSVVGDSTALRLATHQDIDGPLERWGPRHRIVLIPREEHNHKGVIGCSLPSIDRWYNALLTLLLLDGPASLHVLIG